MRFDECINMAEYWRLVWSRLSHEVKALLHVGWSWDAGPAGEKAGGRSGCGASEARRVLSTTSGVRSTLERVATPGSRLGRKSGHFPFSEKPQVTSTSTALFSHVWTKGGNKEHGVLVKTGFLLLRPAGLALRLDVALRSRESS